MLGDIVRILQYEASHAVREFEKDKIQVMVDEIPSSVFKKIDKFYKFKKYGQQMD